MTPYHHAVAYRIWAYAAPREWNCTYDEIADHVGVSKRTVQRVFAAKGWAGRTAEHALNLSNRALSVSRHKRGYDVDINQLPVDELMR